MPFHMLIDRGYLTPKYYIYSIFASGELAMPIRMIVHMGCLTSTYLVCSIVASEKIPYQFTCSFTETVMSPLTKYLNP